MQVLAAFVRDGMQYQKVLARLSERAYFLWLQADRPEGRSARFWGEADRLEEYPTDIEAIFTVIERRSAENQQREKDRGWHFDLRGAYLRSLPSVFERGRLANAHLEGANLIGAHLEEANLVNAHLEGAFLANAHLEGSDLWMAHLEGAHLWGVHLEAAELRDAHLERADLYGDGISGEAHLEGADLRKVHFEGANLSGAHFEGANLWGAYFEGANLWGAHLEGADFSKTEGLTDDELVLAHGDGKTNLPDGVTRPKSWPPLMV